MARSTQQNPAAAETPQGAPQQVQQTSNPHDPSSGGHAPAGAPPVQPAGMQGINPMGLVRPRPVSPQMLGGAPGMPGQHHAETHITGVDGAVVGSAVDIHPLSESAQKVPTPKRWRVAVGGRISIKGNLTVLRPGKELDERQYDLKELRRQGIKLEEVREDDDFQQPHDPLLDDPMMQPPRG